MSILSDNQRRVLQLLSEERSVRDRFYLTGGTALAEFYLRHRRSEDLDFFSESEFEPEDISLVLRKIQKAAGISAFRYTQSFNRNLFFLVFADDTVKTEFTYFPFPRIEQKQHFGELNVDSLIDIAVNKLFTIYQKPRARDFVDLYFIIQKKQLIIKDLIGQAKIKFDHHIDLIQLGAQFAKVRELKDYPKMIVPIKDEVWQDFFSAAAKNLSSEVLE